MSPTRWVELTNAVGIVCKTGANGGTYAQRDIAFKFASWVSVEFELYLIKEFQRLKEEEQKQIGWSAKRELSKINYRIHTDAIKAYLIPSEVTREQAAMKYADEAEGKFDGTIYTIRYFQHDGKGSLRMENGTVFQPNAAICWRTRSSVFTTPRQVRRHRR